MFWLCLAVSIAFWPGTPGAAITPKYAILCVALPAWLFWVRVRITPALLVGLALVAWALASLAWVLSTADAIDALVKLVLVIGCAFVVGQEAENITPGYAGLAIGLVISGGYSIAQKLGFNPVVTGDFQPHVTPPGLWVNPNTQAEIAIPVLLAVLWMALRMRQQEIIDVEQQKAIGAYKRLYRAAKRNARAEDDERPAGRKAQGPAFADALSKEEVDGQAPIAEADSRGETSTEAAGAGKKHWQGRLSRAAGQGRWFRSPQVGWWLLAVGIAPAASLPQARGPLAGLVLAVFCWCVARWRWKAVLAAVPLGLLLFAGSAQKWVDERSFDEHLAIWEDTIDGIGVWGRGIGSYYTLYPQHATREDTSLARPDHAHSDPLELAFELGAPGAVLAAAFFLACLSGALERERLVLMALAIEACAGFPLHNAGTQFLFGLVAGHAARRWVSFRDAFQHGRMALRARLPSVRAAGIHS